MAVFDFKKQYKELYLPKTIPSVIEVPEMSFIAVRGKGDPNEEGGEYKCAVSMLYGIAYTLKMSRKAGHDIKGFYDYAVPPLEGFWHQSDIHNGKDSFQWISVIRLPEFVTENDFRWALDTASAKKKTDFSKAEYLTIEEGLTVQCMHIGSYDTEPETISAMRDYAESQGYYEDFQLQECTMKFILMIPAEQIPKS